MIFWVIIMRLFCDGWICHWNTTDQLFILLSYICISKLLTVKRNVQNRLILRFLISYTCYTLCIPRRFQWLIHCFLDQLRIQCETLFLFLSIAKVFFNVASTILMFYTRRSYKMSFSITALDTTTAKTEGRVYILNHICYVCPSL